MGLLTPPGISIRRFIVSFVRMQYNTMLTVPTKKSSDNRPFKLEFFIFWYFIIGYILSSIWRAALHNKPFTYKAQVQLWSAMILFCKVTTKVCHRQNMKKEN